MGQGVAEEVGAQGEQLQQAPVLDQAAAWSTTTCQQRMAGTTAAARSAMSGLAAEVFSGLGLAPGQLAAVDCRR